MEAKLSPRAGGRAIVESLNLDQSKKRRLFMKLFTQGPPRNGQNELNAEWAGEPDCEGVARHDWSKQRQTLLELREEILKRIHDLAEEAREENPTYSLHMADAATDTIDRDVFLGLVSFEQESLYEIDAALQRIEEGTYGICELTGQPIPMVRLQAIPWVRFSLDVQKRLEGSSHPHIGVLGRIRFEENQQHQAA
jgi:RNA polymerase-binding transcription factor DksA